MHHSILFQPVVAYSLYIIVHTVLAAGFLYYTFRQKYSIKELMIPLAIYDLFAIAMVLFLEVVLKWFLLVVVRLDFFAWLRPYLVEYLVTSRVSLVVVSIGTTLLQCLFIKGQFNVPDTLFNKRFLFPLIFCNVIALFVLLYFGRLWY